MPRGHATLLLLSVGLAACAPPTPEVATTPVVSLPTARPPDPPVPEPDAPAPDEDSGELSFVGTWVSRLDGSILLMSPRTYMLRFPFEGGIRENSAQIVHAEPTVGHLELRFTRVLQDEAPVAEGAGRRLYMLYVIDEEGVLRKGTSAEPWPSDTDGEEFVRRDGIAVPRHGLLEPPPGPDQGL